MVASEQPTVVVVDDEPELRELVCFLLRDEGYRVRCLGSPHEATALAHETEHPGVFLLDLMLPEIDGIDLARSLRADGFPTTPMIAISASSAMLRAARASQLFQETVSKPFDVAALLDTIEQYASSGR